MINVMLLLDLKDAKDERNDFDDLLEQLKWKKLNMLILCGALSIQSTARWTRHKLISLKEIYQEFYEQPQKSSSFRKLVMSPR